MKRGFTSRNKKNALEGNEKHAVEPIIRRYKMATINEDQLGKMLEDISTIKSVIKKNKSLIQQLFLPVHFRWLALVFGTSIIVFSLLFYGLIEHYGGYDHIPKSIKSLVFIIMLLDGVFLSFIKWSNWAKSLLKVDPRFSINLVFNEIFSFRIVHVYAPIVGVTIILSTFFYYKHLPYYIIPTVAIGQGLILNFFGSISGIRQFLGAGYWFIVTGVGIVLFDSIPDLIALAFSYGVGWLILFVASYFPFNSEREV